MNSSLQASIQVKKIRAIALTVSNADCARDFYTQALGFKVMSDMTVNDPNYCKLERIENTKIRIITLQLGTETIKLMQYLDLPQNQVSCQILKHFQVK